MPARLYIPTICALLQTSSACRQAVQQATAKGSAGFAVTDLTKVEQFCAWLPQHAGLVTRLTIRALCKEPAAAAVTAGWQLACSRAAHQRSCAEFTDGQQRPQSVPCWQCRQPRHKLVFMPLPHIPSTVQGSGSSQQPNSPQLSLSMMRPVTTYSSGVCCPAPPTHHPGAACH